MPQQSESALSHSIQLALARLGIWTLRIQSGTLTVGASRVRCAEAGTPDLFCPAANLWLEVKTRTGKLNPAQLAWHKKAKQCGVRVAVVRSVSDAIAEARPPHIHGCDETQALRRELSILVDDLAHEQALVSELLRELREVLDSTAPARWGLDERTPSAPPVAPANPDPEATAASKPSPATRLVPQASETLLEPHHPSTFR